MEYVQDVAFEVPLRWPVGWDRETPAPSAFGLDLGRALDHLASQVRLLGGRRIVVSSNLVLSRRNAKPLERQPFLGDPGIAVYFERDRAEMVMPCDRWNLPEDNIRAIGKTVEAIRGIDRWGAKQMIAAALEGYKALPAPEPEPDWWEVLGVSREAPQSVVQAVIRALLREHHPDLGGSHAGFLRVQRAAENWQVERPPGATERQRVAANALTLNGR